MGNKKTLLVIDNLEDDWAESIIQDADSSIQYDLLTFGFSASQVFLKYDSMSSFLKQKTREIDTKEISALAEADVRAYYLDFMANFPKQRSPHNKSILEVLSDRQRNLWWYLDISEKSIWKEKLIHRLYALVRLFYVCENEKYDEVVVFVRDATLQKAVLDLAKIKEIKVAAATRKIRFSMLKNSLIWFIVIYLLQAFKHSAILFFKLLALKSAGIKSVSKINPGAIGFFSIYPNFWGNAFSGNADEIFFHSIPNELSKNEKVNFIFWLSPWKVLLRKRKEISKFPWKSNVTILEQTFGIADLLSLFDLRLMLKFFRAFNLSKVPFAKIKGLDVSDFVREELFKSLTNPECFLIDRALSRIPFENFKAFIFRLEFQPFERAILDNAKGKTITVGFQHSALGKNFFNYVFTKDELAQYWKRRNDSSSMPLPDHIFVSGQLGLDYMQHAGFPDDRLAVCGAVRFMPLFEYVKKKPSQPELRINYRMPSDKKIIFVATSPLREETFCMLNDLLAAIKEGARAFHIIVKCHPNAKVVPGFLSGIIKIFNEIDNKISYNIFTESIPLYDYILLSDAVLLTGGTVALESMVLGVIPIVYVCPPQFSHNPMVEYPDAVILVDGKPLMRDALDIICNNEKIDKIKSNWRKPIRDMFYDVSEHPGQRFITLLKERIKFY